MTSNGLSICHLQCNCGQDTLSLVQLGAARAVGVDISDAAIAEARQLSLDAGIAASFARADVLSWLEDCEEEKFDVIFVSYGWLAWLGDLSRWARGVASVLKPGGRLVLIEFHPLAWSLGEGGTLTGDAYFEDAPGKKCDDPGGVSDYVRSSGDGLIPDGMEWAEGEVAFTNPQPSIEFQHTVADLISALADASMFVSSMREYPYSNGCQLVPGMRRMAGRRFTMPDGIASIPLMLSVVAVHR